jgi:hypothetical protein
VRDQSGTMRGCKLLRGVKSAAGNANESGTLRERDCLGVHCGNHARAYNAESELGPAHASALVAVGKGDRVVTRIPARFFMGAVPF